ncbi:MAG: TonB-dependent receptor, partial [Acidobacteriota bacterium]|nr:TonB-dependent receptor [Acidobacteriota bacterium]
MSLAYAKSIFSAPARSPRASRIFALLVTTFLLSASLWAQGAAGSIAGTVTDPSGASVPNAKVTVTDVQRGATRTLNTDAAGAYAAPSLTPGTYTVRVEFQGFKTTDRNNIQLEVSQDLRVDLTLQPGDQTQTVTVTGEVAALNTTSAELGGSLTNQVINDLPLNGRNFENLLDLRPGVVKYPGNSGWAQSTNGLRPHDNFFMVDGINSNDPWMAQSVMNAVMAAGDAGTMLPIDAIDEFKTNQNPRAEYGWKPGAIVNVGIKSGSNAFHGTAYAYGRTDAWDANDFFAPKGPLSLEQYGGSVGGRIIRDRLFFFGNYESQQYEVSNSVSHKVPITVAGVGDPSRNLIGACLLAKAAGAVAPLSAQLAGLSTSCVPLPNAPGLFPVSSTGTYVTSLASSNKIYSGVGKLDYRLNDKNSFNGLYFQSPGDGTFVDNPTLQIAQPWLTNQYAQSQVLSGNWIWVPSSTVVNSLRMGYSRYHQIFQSNDSTQNPASYSYNGSTYNINTGQTNPLYFGLPVFTFNQGGYGFQLGLGWPKTVGPNTVDQFTDSVSIQKGSHGLKFGGEFLINHSLNNVTANTKGPLRFGPSGDIGALQNFFAGNMNRGQITAGDLSRDLQDKGFALFMQDDWRVTSRFTVNAGLRYEITTVFSEANNQMGNFIPSQGLLQTGTSKLDKAFNGDHNNFAPRLGFAWDIGGNGKTVVRGGGGIYYEQGSFDSFMAIGNLLGLRTTPTGVNLYSNGNTTPTTAGGNINVGQVTFTKSGLGSATTPGTVKYGYFNNSS